jgi:hypothetical protein
VSAARQFAEALQAMATRRPEHQVAAVGWMAVRTAAASPAIRRFKEAVQAANQRGAVGSVSASRTGAG